MLFWLYNYYFMSTRWQIWIDTGGTFTDAVALTPNGLSQRVKVLSRGCLRGRLLERLASGRYRMQQRWGISTSIFKGYSFYALADAGITATVLSADPATGILELDRDLPLPSPIDFEISAGEVAPVLAARLLTATPLDAAFPPLDMRIGTTKGTNALLEKKGTGVALLITKGFGDLPAIGNQQRPHLFQLDIPAPALLFDQVIEVEERLGADGELLIPLTSQELQRVTGQLTCRSVAVAFFTRLPLSRSRTDYGARPGRGRHNPYLTVAPPVARHRPAASRTDGHGQCLPGSYFTKLSAGHQPPTA